MPNKTKPNLNLQNFGKFGNIKWVKLTGLTPGEHAMSFVKKYEIDEPLLMTEKEREWQTFHSSSLTEIFFETLDGIDCLRDPFSILK